MLNADPSKVSVRAKKRGLPQVLLSRESVITIHQASFKYFLFTIFLAFFCQLGTLGAGNHYAEIQVVDEIYDKFAANKMGIEHKGQVCIMIHSGSRGFGHQVATGMFVNMRKNQPERNLIR